MTRVTIELTDPKPENGVKLMPLLVNISSGADFAERSFHKPDKYSDSY
jgi:hypothetical protein